MVVKYVGGFLEFWYDFIIGDDWTVAAAVAATLALLVLLSHEHANVWWLLPLVVVAVLGVSLKRASQR